MTAVPALPGRFALAALLWAGGVLVLLAVPGGTPGRTASHAIWLTLAVAASLATWHRARRDAVGRRGWLLVLAGVLMAGAYSGLKLLDVTVGVPAPPLLLVALTIAPYPLGMIGILSWPIAHRPRPIQALLDATIFAGSVFFLVWTAGLGSQVRAGTVSAIEIVLNLAWFGGATLIVGVVTYVGGRSFDRLRGPLGLIGLGVLISMICAALSARLTMTGVHFQAHPVELLWLATLICFMLAALSPRPVERQPDAGDRDPTSFAGDLIIYLPAIAVLVVSLVIGASQDPVLVGLDLTIGAAFFSRQFLALHDGRVLSNDLERKVEERTRQLEQSQAALVRGERMQAIGQVAGGVAHDFRNVLQAIYSQVEVLQLDVTGDEPRVRLAAIQRAAESGTELVRSLLRIGGPGAGVPEDLDLAEVVTSLAWVFRTVEDAGIEVERTTIPAPVRADRSQLEQVVTNLAVNARDAMPSGGRLVVATGPADAPGMVRLVVTDTGVGMTPEQAARIFEPFYTTKAERHGTGMGLSTVYAIVTGLGGTISVDSTPGVGSRFEIHLPTPPTPSSR